MAGFRLRTFAAFAATSLFAVILSASAPGQSQQRTTTPQPKPTPPATDALAAALAKVQIFDAKEIAQRRADIKALKDLLEKSQLAVADRLEYLAKLDAALVAAEKVQKSSGDLAREIDLVKGQPPPALAITRAMFGDVRNGHACDATAYMVEKCQIRRSADSDASNCFHQLPAAEQPKNVCGYDPSPQGVKELYVEWSCGGKTQAPARIPPTGYVRLICHVHEMKPSEAKPDPPPPAQGEGDKTPKK